MQHLKTIFEVINASWRSAKLDINEGETARVWEMALRDLPTSSLILGMEALARCEDKFAPNPGRVRRMCLDAAETKRQEDNRNKEIMSDLRRKLEIRDRSPKESAWEATQMAFARYILTDNDDSGLGRIALKLLPMDDHGDKYKTNFDWQYVARSASKPASDSLADHQAAFAELKSIFEREWAAA